MSYKKYTTLPKLWWLIMLFSLVSVFSASTLTDLGSVSAIVSALVAVGLVIWALIQSTLRRMNRKGIRVFFLIPRNRYPHKIFPGAPEKEKITKKLAVGIGDYHVLLKVETKKDVSIYPIGLVIKGDPDNKPLHQGKDNGFIFEKLPDGSSRDWVGDNTIPPKEYPRPLRPAQSLIDCNVIKTSGQWAGKFHVQIQTTETIVDRYLDFAVSLSQDDVPFLKIPHSPSFINVPTIPDATQPASTTQVGKNPNWRVP